MCKILHIRIFILFYRLFRVRCKLTFAHEEILVNTFYSDKQSISVVSELPDGAFRTKFLDNFLVGPINVLNGFHNCSTIVSPGPRQA